MGVGGVVELCLDGDTKRVIGKQDERPGEGLHRMRVQPAEQWSINCTASVGLWT